MKYACVVAALIVIWCLTIHFALAETWVHERDFQHCDHDGCFPKAWDSYHGTKPGEDEFLPWANAEWRKQYEKAKRRHPRG